MFVVIMVTFFQWTRETRSSAAMGWLESARRTSMAERIAESSPAGPVGDPAPNGTKGATSRLTDVDEDDDQLAAYNAYLTRINSHGSDGGSAG
jgi:hypothetical protein